MASATPDIRSSLPTTCTVSTPTSTDSLNTFLSQRWMTLGSSTLPFASVTPTSESDIEAVVKYAATNGLKILPQCGACGGVVITNNKTLYLNMQRFRDVGVNGEKRTVTFGGGALTGDVIPAVTERGFYTGWANLSAVGMTGTILGGGLNLFMGTKGHTCDNVVSARMVTGKGVVEVSASSPDSDKRELFNLLKGAGAGLGVVVSMTMRIYPISKLGLEDGTKFPEVTAMFSRENWGVAAKLWDTFAQNHSSGPLSVAFALMAAPPPMGAMAGKPLIMAQAQYPGPASEAEKAFAPFEAEEVKSTAVMVGRSMTDLRKMNDHRDAMMTKGFYMDCYNGLVYSLSSHTLLRAAERFAEFVQTNGVQNVGRSMTVLHPMPTATLTSIDPKGETGLCYRDRGFMVQTVTWDVKSEFVAAAEQYGKDVLGIVRADDAAKGVPNAILAGNARVEADMSEILTKEKMERVRQAKREWDPKGVFWSPVVDGWVH